MLLRAQRRNDGGCCFRRRYRCPCPHFWSNIYTSIHTYMYLSIYVLCVCVEREREVGGTERESRRYACAHVHPFVGMGVGVVGLPLCLLTPHETWHSAGTRSRAKGYRHGRGSSRKAAINGGWGGGRFCAPPSSLGAGASVTGVCDVREWAIVL